MKFKDYVAQLQQFLKDNPETAEWETITSSDSEGNDYNGIYYSPTKGHYSPKGFITKFTDEESIENGDKEDMPLNAVCVN